VGCILLAARSNFLSRVAGLGAGAWCGWLCDWPRVVWGNVVLAFLGASAGLALGFCLGDWRRLMGTYESDMPRSPGQAAEPVETITDQLGPQREPETGVRTPP
jgi:hypothetical protein